MKKMRKLLILILVAAGAWANEPFHDDIATNDVTAIGTELTFNEAGAAVDLRIETDDEGNLVFIDGSEDDFLLGGTTAAAAAVSISFNTTALDNIVFNEQAADADFRVETTGEAAAFWVDGSTDRVGIGGVVSAGNIIFYAATGQGTFGGPVSVNTLGTASGDFRAAGDTESSALWVDASADQVGIGGTVGSGDIEFFPATGAAVFNEKGNDADFRVEGDTDANLFYVDAGNEEVLIGGSTSAGAGIAFGNEGGAIFNVQGNSTFFQIKGGSNDNTLYVTGSSNAVSFGTATPFSGGSTIAATGRAEFNGAASAQADAFVVDGSVTEAIRVDSVAEAFIVNEASGDIDFRVESDNSAGMLVVDSALDGVYIGDVAAGAPDFTFLATGSASFNQQTNDADFTVSSDTVASMLVVDAGADTVYIGGAGASAEITFNYLGAAVFNDQGDVNGDFRVEADTETQAFRVDAGGHGAVIIGDGSALGDVTGYLHIPSWAGAPTTAPTNKSGTIAIGVDRTNRHLYMETDNGWRSIQRTKPHYWGRIGPNTSALSMTGDGLLLASIATDASASYTHTAAGMGFAQLTAASSGSDAGMYTPAVNAIQVGSLPHLVTLMDIGDVADVRWFIGLCDAGSVSVAVGADDPATYQCAFQFSTPRADTNWQIALDDNGTQTLTDTGYAAATGVHTFEIDFITSTSAIFRIYDSSGVEQYEATISSGLPSTGNSMKYTGGVESQAAAAKTSTTYCVELYGP